MKIKIKKGIAVHGAIAFYNPKKHEIIYDKDVEKYPKLFGFALKHEKKHAKYRYNFSGQAKTEVIDYFRQYWNHGLRKEYLDYIKNQAGSYGDMEEMPAHFVLGMLLLNLFLVFYHIFVLLPVMAIRELQYRIVSKFRGGEE